MATQTIVETFDLSVTNFETNLKVNLDRIVEILISPEYVETGFSLTGTIGMLEDCDFYHMWMVIYTEY